MFRPVLLFACIAVVCSQHVHDRQFLGPRSNPSSPPPFSSSADVPSTPEFRPPGNEDRPNDYKPNYAYGYEPEQCIPRDGPSEFVPKDYVKRDVQDFGQPIYGSAPNYEDDNGPTRPSVSEESGYIPEDIIG